ncbi:MAG: hypothetical protein E7177_02085 [Erysipelotrichaceae bacterium]|nr:hypothetical protein [Erysipelotrichaceae bacterium]
MKKFCLVLSIILSLLVGCRSNNEEINVLNVNISFTSYNEHIVVINDYQEFTEKVSNNKEIKEINDDFFLSYDLVCLLVSSNAEEYHNKIKFIKAEQINSEFIFHFEGKIKDNSTDLAFFLTSFAFKVNKELNIDEKNIEINKKTIVGF